MSTIDRSLRAAQLASNKHTGRRFQNSSGAAGCEAWSPTVGEAPTVVDNPAGREGDTLPGGGEFQWAPGVARVLPPLPATARQQQRGRVDRPAQRRWPCGDCPWTGRAIALAAAQALIVAAALAVGVYALLQDELSPPTPPSPPPPAEAVLIIRNATGCEELGCASISGAPTSVGAQQACLRGVQVATCSEADASAWILGRFTQQRVSGRPWCGRLSLCGTACLPSAPLSSPGTSLAASLGCHVRVTELSERTIVALWARHPSMGGSAPAETEHGCTISFAAGVGARGSFDVNSKEPRGCSGAAPCCTSSRPCVCDCTQVRCIALVAAARWARPAVDNKDVTDRRLPALLCAAWRGHSADRPPPPPAPRRARASRAADRQHAACTPPRPQRPGRWKWWCGPAATDASRQMQAAAAADPLSAITCRPRCSESGAWAGRAATDPLRVARRAILPARTARVADK
jgi:hypothetical protein